MPEPTEAMVGRLIAALGLAVSMIRSGERMTPQAEFEFDAALAEARAVSPGCRGAELAEAAEQFLAAAHDNPTGEWCWYMPSAEDRLRQALAAFRASGEAGPDFESYVEDAERLVDLAEAFRGDYF